MARKKLTQADKDYNLWERSLRVYGKQPVEIVEVEQDKLKQHPGSRSSKLTDLELMRYAKKYNVPLDEVRILNKLVNEKANLIADIYYTAKEKINK